MNNDTVTKHIREPLFHISKRISIPWYKSWLIRLAALAVALLMGALVIMLLTDIKPVEIYKTMYNGSFKTERNKWEMLRDLAKLLCVSLAVTPAFKMKFWNIGAEGQSLIGALASAACMIYLGDTLSNIEILPVMLVASVVCGIIWAVLPAYFKAKYNTNETLFTLMMNYIAIQLVRFCTIFWEGKTGTANGIGIINRSSKIGWLPFVNGQRYFMCVAIVAVVTIIMFVYLRYTKHGYEISVVGESQNTAKYVGINVKKVIIRTMIVSGALCGLAGFLFVAGVDHTISESTIGGLGFTAIMVSWLAKFNPLFMVFTSFLIVFLDGGAGAIAKDFKLNDSLGDILTGIILLFIIGCEFFIQYKINFRKSGKKEA